MPLTARHSKSVHLQRVNSLQSEGFLDAVGQVGVVEDDVEAEGLGSQRNSWSNPAWNREQPDECFGPRPIVLEPVYARQPKKAHFHLVFKGTNSLELVVIQEKWDSSNRTQDLSNY